MERMSSSDHKQLEEFLENVTYDLNFKGREFRADEMTQQKARSCKEKKKKKAHGGPESIPAKVLAGQQQEMKTKNLTRPNG